MSFSFLANPAFWSGVSSAATGAATAYSIGTAVTQKGTKMPSLPKPVKAEDLQKQSTQKAKQEADKRRRALTKTTYTSPTGLRSPSKMAFVDDEAADIARKTLLGQ